MSGNFENTLKSLTHVMARTYKAWKTPAGEPSYPGMADNIRQWQSDMNKMANFPESYTPSFMKAREMIDKAWENRDSREKAIRMVGRSVENLSRLDAERSHPEVRSLKSERTTAALLGEATVKTADDWWLASAYDATSMLDSMLASNRSYINDSIVRDAVKAIRNIPATTQQEKHTVESAARSVSNAFNYKSDRVFRSHIKSALRDINNVAQKRYASRNASYTPDLTRPVAIKALRMLEDIERSFNRIAFDSPGDFLGGAVRDARHVKSYLEQYDDPVAVRYANSIASSMRDAERAARGSYKSNNWNSPAIKGAFDSATSAIDKLKIRLREASRR